MRVLLINSPTKDKLVIRDMAGGFGFDGAKTVFLPPLDLAYMAATLLNKGYEAKIIDSDVQNYKIDDIRQFIDDYRPDIIIATVSLPSLYNDCSFLKEIRQHYSIKLIAKTNISYPAILKEILERSSVDLCIYGECDTNIDKIISRGDRKGIAYFKNGVLQIEENNLIDNLDDLPLPARSLLPNEKYRYVLLGDKVTTMQISRGCPYPCSYYCPYPLVQGKKWRVRSSEHIIREIEDIVDNYQIKKILFRDAVFTLDKNRIYQICNLIIEKKLDITWWCETRVDCLDLELIQKMKQAGCLGMNIGVETGNPEILETQAKIGTTLEKLKTIRKDAKELRLKLHFLLMIGLPKETKRSIYETYKLICDLKPETIGVCIVTPYPGTQLYQEAKEKGWIETEDWTQFGGHFPVMHTENLSARDLLKARDMLNYAFYLSNKNSIIDWVKLKFLDFSFKKWVSQ
ncbi:MAG: radical SAM protein [Candidatus Omnitrophica bacterium]|nr:radical SAM protein [Candidatus Omnitrophota bacterium]